MKDFRHFRPLVNSWRKSSRVSHETRNWWKRGDLQRPTFGPVDPQARGDTNLRATMDCTCPDPATRAASRSLMALPRFAQFDNVSAPPKIRTSDVRVVP